MFGHPETFLSAHSVWPHVLLLALSWGACWHADVRPVQRDCRLSLALFRVTFVTRRDKSYEGCRQVADNEALIEER